jgi:hypothetical protein
MQMKRQISPALHLPKPKVIKMLRLVGIVFSGLIVASIVIPWVTGPQIGVWAPIDLLKSVDFSKLDPSQIKSFLSTPLNGDPVNAMPWAILAFAVSFPLAALFALIGLLGYFSKPMGLFLGAIPVALGCFAYYAIDRATQTAPDGLDSVNIVSQMMQTRQITIAWGLPIYLGSAALLFLTALFTSPRRNP